MLLIDAEQTQRENEHINAVLQPCFTSGEIKSDFKWRYKKNNKMINCKRKVSATGYPVTVVSPKAYQFL
jgi:hypothetical protein